MLGFNEIFTIIYNLYGYYTKYKVQQEINVPN